MKGNWIKLHRELLDNPTVMIDGDYLAVWVWLLLHATSKRKAVRFGGKQVYLKPGELTTGRRRIVRELRISESKVQRILKTFENEQQIEQRTDRQCRLISILNWDKYQQNEQRNEQRVNNERTTSEQRVNTKQECKECKEEREGHSPVSRSELFQYVREKNLDVDAEVFWNYYEENDWTKKNGLPVKDWKKTLATWAAREKKTGNRPAPIEPPRIPEYKHEEVKDPVQMPDEIRRKIEKVFS